MVETGYTVYTKETNYSTYEIISTYLFLGTKRTVSFSKIITFPTEYVILKLEKVSAASSSQPT